MVSMVSVSDIISLSVNPSGQSPDTVESNFGEILKKTSAEEGGLKDGAAFGNGQQEDADHQADAEQAPDLNTAWSMMVIWQTVPTAPEASVFLPGAENMPEETLPVQNALLTDGETSVQTKIFLDLENIPTEMVESTSPQEQPEAAMERKMPATEMPAMSEEQKVVLMPDEGKQEQNTEGSAPGEKNGFSGRTMNSGKPDTVSKDTARENVVPENASAEVGMNAAAGSTSQMLSQVNSLPQMTDAKPAAEVSSQKTVSLEELPQRLFSMVAEEGKEIEISLEPAELGKLTIKASFEEGRTVVSILCSNTKTAEILSSHAGSLGSIMETNLGTPTEIVLEKGAQEHAGENYTDADAHNGSQNREEESRKKQKDSNENFLQQLRLGLI